MPTATKRPPQRAISELPLAQKQRVVQILRHRARLEEELQEILKPLLPEIEGSYVQQLASEGREGGLLKFLKSVPATEPDPWDRLD